MRPHVLFLILIMITGCAKQLQVSLPVVGGSLGGSIPALNGIVFHQNENSFISSAYAVPVCNASVYARLYPLQADGTLEENPIASVEVENGRYDFPKSALPLLTSANVSHQVVIEGCDQYLSRPITDLNNSQNITWQSSLIGSATYADLNKTLYQTDRPTVKSLIDSLTGPSVLGAYTNLDSTSSLSSQFTSAFADTHTKLLESHPMVTLSSFPSMGNEGLSNSFTVSAMHFDPSYTIAYEWHLDGVEQSTAASWAYIPSADSSGNHTITLFVGKDVGTFHVDRAKPFYTVTKTFQVIDTIPAAPLNFTIPAMTNVANISASVATGAALANCASFQYFLLRDTAGTPSASDPDFSRTCVTNTTQVENFTLTGADGTKTVYLWTKDTAGNVSSSSQSRTIMLDRVLPTATLGGVVSTYGGGKTLSFNYTSSDAHSGLASVELFLSYNASAYASVKTLTFGGTTDSFTLPVTDATDARIRIVATDLAGNIQTVTSAAFTIDSTAPAAPAFTLASAANTNNTTISFNATCTGISEVLIGESVTASDTTGWVPCTASMSTVISGTTQGTRSIRIYARDAVQNVSPATTINVNFDNTVPTVSITAQPAALSSETSFNFQFSGTDNITAPGSLTFQCALNGGSFASCSSPHATTGYTAGNNTFYVRSYDQVGNVSTTASYTWDHNTTQPTISFTSVASLTPANSNSLAARSITVGGTGISSYKYTVIRSGACSAVDFSALSEITLSGNQTFSFTPTTDGTYQVCAIGKSTYGVWQLDANASASPVLTIDTVVPTFSSLALSPAPVATSTTPSVSGITKVSTTVTLHIDSPTCVSSALASVTSHASTGAFSLTATALSVDNAHNYYVKSTDSSGNTLCSSALPYTLDRVNPVVSFTFLDGGEVVKGSQATAITYTATDLNMATTPISLEYSLNNGVNWTQIATGQTNSGTYSWNMPGFNSTTAKIRITAIDRAGNTFTKESTSTFTIDSSAPIVTLTTLTGGQVVRAGTAQAINWTASDNNTTGNWITLSYSSDSGITWTAITSTTNTGSYSWTVPAAVDSSTYRVKVTATDRVGQVTESASGSNIIVDSTAPTVTLTSFTGGQAVLGNSNQTITWNASDANFGSTPITLHLSTNSGSTWSTIASNLPNTGSYSWYTNVPDAGTYRVRVTATDAAGINNTSSSTSDFVVSTQAPNLSQTTRSSPYYSRTDTSVTFGGTCDTGYTITITGAESTTLACPAGTWSWTTATQSTDASRTYNFSQTNAVLTLTISAIWVRDTVAPSLTSVNINNGNAQTPAPMVSVAVTTPETGLSVRLANSSSTFSSCQAQYADNNWQPQSGLTTNFSHLLSSGDGDKKVCVWAKDQAGNVSTISPAAGTANVDMDTITYASGNPPRVVAFEAVNDGGGAFQGMNNAYQNDPLKITWTVTDVESLDNNPVLLDYTLNGTTWTPIEAGFGGLSGNPTSYTHTYYGFSAPTANFFRVRIRVKDSAGNISSELMSKAFNTSPWTVVAGNPGRGVGGSAKSAYVTRSNTQFTNVAMNPLNGDVYFIDHGFGVKKMSGATGIVSLFIRYDGSNLGTSGTLDSTKALDTQSMRLLFDNKGFLYLFVSNAYLVYNEYPDRVYRINTSTLEYTTYLGTGMGNSTGINPADAFVFMSSALAFDEANSLYFTSSCTPGVRFVRGGSTSNTVLMKVTQNPDGTPGTVTRVAGNCTRGTPTSGVAAISNPFNDANDGPWQMLLTVWGNGRFIYYTDGQGRGFKIIDGISYKSALNIGYGGMVYDPVSGLIKSANEGTIRHTVPNLSGDNGETITDIMNGQGTGATCADDGTAAAQVCGSMNGGVISSSGKFFFIEGLDGGLNRLRYLDDNNNIQTLLGAQSFSGAGQLPSNAKGGFAGIHYKKSTDPLSLVYPEGLYFMERFGGVFGYFTDTTTVKLLGNQSGTGPSYGTPLASNQSLGALAEQHIGAQSSMFFDRNGKIWLRNHHAKISTLDENMILTDRTPSPGGNWNVSNEGGDPRSYSVWPYGGWGNLVVKDDGKLLLIGGDYDPSDPNPTRQDTRGMIKIFDYESNVIKYVIGNSAGPGFTSDQPSPGSVKNAAMDNCMNNHCSTYYDQSTDRVYFSERGRVRYITNPENPSLHTLVTVFNNPNGDIWNFTLSPNKKYIMYVLSNGRLYCHAISAADNSAICNNDPNLHTTLGPPPGLSHISKGGNQLTWRNDSILYISTYMGEIYQYILYH